MDLPELIEYCLAKKGVEETTPFGPDVLVYKVMGKMFALTSPDGLPCRVNLKCDPDRAVELRDQYDFVLPGYHMNKRHWNTVVLEDGVPGAMVCELIDHSYDLVVQGMTRKQRVALDES